MVTLVLRWLDEPFGDAVSATVAAPIPIDGAADSQLVKPLVVHAQPRPAVTVTLELPPAEPNDNEVGQTP